MILLFVVMIIIYSFQSLFCKLYSSARSGEGALQFAVFYAAVTGLCTLAVNGFGYHPSATTLVMGLLNAVMILVYNVSMLKAGTLGSYAFMMICMLSGGILLPLFYDLLYLGGSFSFMQIFAVVLMLGSFILMNLDGVKAKKNAKYLIWCAVLMMANGLYSIFMHLQQTLMDFTEQNEMIITTFLGMAVLTTIFELIFARKSYLEGFRMSKKALLFMIISSVCATLAVNMLMVIMESINVTVRSAISNGGILVLSAIYAFTLFREKLTLPSVAGILMACTSIVMLSL